MALDGALLQAALSGRRVRPILRLYAWSRPTLSVGVHQRLSDELMDRCAGYGVDVVRRPTGGTAVLHGDDLTYSVVAHAGGRGVLEAYCYLAEALIAGFARLGMVAEVGSRNSTPPVRSLASNGACFASTVGADLQVSGAKICGSAQVRRSGWLLQHGSLPLRDVRLMTGKLLRHPGANSSACLEQLRPGTTAEELAGAVVWGFERLWGPASPVTKAESLSETAQVRVPAQTNACLTL